MKPITLQPIDPAVQLPDALEDVFVFGALVEEDPEWHIGYFTDESPRAGEWHLTDSGSVDLTFAHVYAWAEIPPDDPRTPETPKVAAAA